MTEETGITSAPGTGETAAMDAKDAAASMQQARERAGSELRIRRPVLFVTWGLAVLIGYGAMWLTVRGQHPFQGPAWPTLLLALLLLAIAAIITAQVVDRAASGVGGRSEVQRGIFVLALGAGYAALLIEKIALVGAGVSPITSCSLVKDRSSPSPRLASVTMMRSRAGTWIAGSRSSSLMPGAASARWPP